MPPWNLLGDSVALLEKFKSGYATKSCVPLSQTKLAVEEQLRAAELGGTVRATCYGDGIRVKGVDRSFVGRPGASPPIDTAPVRSDQPSGVALPVPNSFKSSLRVPLSTPPTEGIIAPSTEGALRMYCEGTDVGGTAMHQTEKHRGVFIASCDRS
ncbi:hypothetical protein B0H13DRAFT_1890391 [Mycena leptocephala]|nr:hypothetical protein B0H13DRAFT_1890391 [Mycena leptocephala]